MNGLRKRTITQLIEDFEETQFTVLRKWIRKELEIRNAEAFDEWVASGEESPREFFI